MKKYIYFLSIIFLTFSACTSVPQVTVTSEVTVTLTAIPTLHPQFAALQESIAASGERFTLHADGLLYDGETPVPGVTVSPDGAMTITVDGETVTLDPADVDFDDEKGITIEGYELDEETGAWVEAISEAMQQTNKLIETYGLADEVAEGKITVTEEGGAVNVTDNETGTVLMRTIGEQTKYELGFAVDGIAAKSCEPTDFRPNKRGLLLAEYAKAYLVYMNKIMKELGFKKYNANLYSILIDREKQCWGLVVSNDIIFYRDGEGVAHGLPLIAIPESKIEDFQVTR